MACTKDQRNVGTAGAIDWSIIPRLNLPSQRHPLPKRSIYRRNRHYPFPNYAPEVSDTVLSADGGPKAVRPWKNCRS